MEDGKTSCVAPPEPKKRVTPSAFAEATFLFLGRFLFLDCKVLAPLDMIPWVLEARVGTSPECQASGASIRTLDRESMPGNGGFFPRPLPGIGPDAGRPYPARHLPGAGTLSIS